MDSNIRDENEKKENLNIKDQKIPNVKVKKYNLNLVLKII